MSSPIPRDAYVIIIGAMKCGTSSLFHYLTAHPEICASVGKEPEYFSEKQRHGVQAENYTDLFSFDPSVHKYALEASTGYTKYPLEPNVPKKIHDYGITPKFIYIVRDPFDRIQSHYNYMQKHSFFTLNIDDPHLIETSNYFLQLEQYRRHFPVEDILILDFDDIKENPAQVLKKVYGFLGLRAIFPTSYEIKNMTPTVSRYKRILGRSKIALVIPYVPKPLKNIGNLVLQKVAPIPKRTLTGTEREFIHNELKTSMSNLRNAYGVDVAKWGF